jgi:phosphate transport system substrate-binding protein
MTFVDMINKDGKTVAPNAEGFKAAAANADWANAVSYYVILTDEPGAKSWPGLWIMTSAVAVSRLR